MKIDMHVHTCYSKHPSQWLLKKIGAQESYLSPLDMYNLSISRGMTAVTITDHDTIDGSLDIIHLPNTFISVELTTYFPEDGCKVHVLVYNISEKIFKDINLLKENIYNLIHYLNKNNIFHVIAHPFYSVNDRMNLDKFEKLVLMFRNFEINGDQGYLSQKKMKNILENLSFSDIKRLQNIHNYIPLYEKPWKKRFTGGSDDHSGLHVGLLCYTEVKDVNNISDFFQALNDGYGTVRSTYSNPRMTSQKLYSIAYQHCINKSKWLRFSKNSILSKFFDRILLGNNSKYKSYINFPWQKIYNIRNFLLGQNKSIIDLLWVEAEKQLNINVELVKLIDNVNPKNDSDIFFNFIDKLSNKALYHLSNDCINRFFSGNFINLFHSIGSAATIYALLIPYFITYTRYCRERSLSNIAEQAFSKNNKIIQDKYVFLMDTPNASLEKNKYIQNLINISFLNNSSKTLITCGKQVEIFPNIQNTVLDPIGTYHPKDLNGISLVYPPFLEMTDFCFKEEFSSIIAITPGPLGLAALGLSNILEIPIYSYYFKDMIFTLLGNNVQKDLETIIWSYLTWYYNQINGIYVNSKKDATELMENGVLQDKIILLNNK